MDGADQMIGGIQSKDQPKWKPSENDAFLAALADLYLHW